MRSTSKAFLVGLMVLAVATGCSGNETGSILAADVGVDAQAQAADTTSSCPAFPTSPEDDPCMVCKCDEQGVLICNPRDIGEGCTDSNCCTTASACVPCPDGEDCPASGLMCQAELTQQCDDGTICTEDTAVCEKGQCTCVHTPAPNGTQCLADPHACTTGDTCFEGQCMAGAPADLDDGNPCTTGICVKGLVQQKALDGPCNDGDSCTTGDTCILGQCVPDALVECPDHPCASASYCDPAIGECVIQFKADGAACEPDNPCTTSAVCQAGVCTDQSTKSCEDGNPCTEDACDPETGACFSSVKPDLTPCGPAGSCIGSQVCEAGVCTPPEPTECDDKDPCTIDTCGPETGECIFTPAENGTSCTLPDDACVKTASCQEGTCVGIETKSCDDSDPCTEDSCDPEQGCEWKAIPGCGEPASGCSEASGRFVGTNCLMITTPVVLPGTELTVEFWMKVNSYDGGSFGALVDGFEGASLKQPGMMVSLQQSGPWAKSVHYQETYPSFNADGSQNGKAHGLLTKGKFEQGDWHHFAAVHDVGGKVRIYIDGDYENGIGWDAFYETMSNGENIYIGCKDGKQWFFEGLIDELRISSVARYAVGGFDPNDTLFVTDQKTIALYHFDEKAGDTVLDHSGNEHHAVWVNDPAWGEAAPAIACD